MATFRRKWGTAGSGDGQFNYATGICVYNDEVYVLDGPTYRLQVFDVNGTYRRKWEVNIYTRAIYAYNNKVYIAHSYSWIVYVYGTDGAYYGIINIGSGSRGIFVYNDEIYVTIYSLHKVEVYNLAGVFQREWGSEGSAESEFDNPTGITIDNNEVYVTDQGNNRIQVFETDGTYKRHWGSSGAGDGEFSNPTGITMYNNEAYVVDTGNDRVQVFGYDAFENQFQSVGVIPQDDADDEVWIVATRYIDGSVKSYIEYFKGFNVQELEDAFFVDCGLTYDGVPATVISGLDHLEGREVTILADGLEVAKKTVASGSITLDVAASKVHIGLGYKSKVKLLPIEAGAELGTAQGKIQRVHKVDLRLYKSLKCEVGTENQMDSVKFDDNKLYTGIKSILFPQGHDIDIQPIIEQDSPLPLTILAVVPEVETKESY